MLFIAAIAVHYVLQGLGLVFFGGEGLRAAAVSDAKFRIGPIEASAQSLLVIFASVAVMGVLWLFFGRSVYETRHAYGNATSDDVFSHRFGTIVR